MISYLIIYFGVSVFLFMGISMYLFMDKDDIKRYLLISIFWILYIPLWVSLMIAVMIVEYKLKKVTGQHYFRTEFSSLISDNFRFSFVKVLFMRKKKLEKLWNDYQVEKEEQKKIQLERIENMKKREEFAKDTGW